MPKRQTDVLQVEQLFDSGTHPTIQDSLFAGEYGPTAGPARPVDHPKCPGQLTIEEIKP